VNLLSIPMSTLVDRALADVRNQYEVGRIAVRSDSIDADDTQFTLDTAANVGNILEFGSELMVVRVKSNDVNPVYTVKRGWFGTTPAAHDANDVGLIDPTFTRRQAALGVQRAFPAMMAGRVWPRVTSALTAIDDPSATVDGRTVVELPLPVVDVIAVRYGLDDVPGWNLLTDYDTDTYDGPPIILPFGWSTEWGVSVTYQTPYRWSSYPDEPGEDDTVDVPEEAQFVPSAYATAYLLSGREYSRTELDRSEEQARTEPVRGGASRAVVRDAWATFYRMLDEARRVDPLLPMRPYVSMSL
jgi:hypothetical protein